MEKARIHIYCGDGKGKTTATDRLCLLGGIEVPLPDVDEPSLRRISFDLRSSDGRVIAHNHHDVAIHPARAKPAQSRELVWSPDEDIRERFRALGYSIARAFEESTLIVSRTHNTDVPPWPGERSASDSGPPRC